MTISWSVSRREDRAGKEEVWALVDRVEKLSGCGRRCHRQAPDSPAVGLCAVAWRAAAAGCSSSATGGASGTAGQRWTGRALGLSS